MGGWEYVGNATYQRGKDRVWLRSAPLGGLPEWMCAKASIRLVLGPYRTLVAAQEAAEDQQRDDLPEPRTKAHRARAAQEAGKALAMKVSKRRQAEALSSALRCDLYHAYDLLRRAERGAL